MCKTHFILSAQIIYKFDLLKIFRSKCVKSIEVIFIKSVTIITSTVNVQDLTSSTMTSSKIDAPLAEILNGGEPARVMVSFTDNTEEKLNEIGGREYADREEQLNTMQREMTAFSDKSQAAVIALLEKEKERVPITWTSQFMTNQIIVNGADLKLVEDIAAIENVATIDGEKFVELL